MRLEFEHCPQCGLTIGKLIIAEIRAVQVEQVESEKAGFAAAEEKIIESWPTFGVDADNLAIKNSGRSLERLCD